MASDRGDLDNERIKVIIPDCAKLIFQTTLPVMISSINYANHLGHDHLITLLHESRIRFLSSHHLSEDAIAENVGLFVVSLAVNYLHQGFHGDNLDIQLFCSKLNRSSCEMYYKVLNAKNAQILACAQTGLVFFNYQTKTAVSIPQVFINIVGCE